MRVTRFLVAAAAAVAVACNGGSTSVPTPTGTSTPVTSPAPSNSPGPDGTDHSVAPSPSPTPSPEALRGPATMPALHPSVDGYPQGRAQLRLADGTRWDIPILVAATEADRSHGLMEVPDVPPATGMGFVFEENQSCCFWMKGTETDLDIAWIATDGTVVGMTTMTVCRSEDCPLYRPLTDTTYRYALEVRAGWLADIGLEVGDHVQLLDANGEVPTPS